MKKKNVGFTLVELLAVLVILALLLLLAGSSVIRLINGLDKDDSELNASKIKAIENAAEKWSLDNIDKFDDGVSAESVPLDVVFLVDATRDMKDEIMSDGEKKGQATVEAINAVIDILSENQSKLSKDQRNRIGFVFFADTSIEQKSTGLLLASDFENANDSNRIRYKKTGTKTDGKDIAEYQFLGEKYSIDRLNYTLPAVQTAAKILLNSKLDEVKRIPVIIHVSEGETLYGSTDNATTGDDYLKNKSENYLVQKEHNYGIHGTTWMWDPETMRQLNEVLADQEADYKKHVKGTAADLCEGFGLTKYKGTTSNKYIGYCPVDWILNYANGYDAYGTKRVTIPYNLTKENTSKMILNVMQTYARAKKEISAKYDASMYIYTVGIGADREYGKFMLNTGSSGLEGLKNAGNALNGLDKTTYAYFDTLWHVDVGLDLYDSIKNMPKESYDYVTEAFINPPSSEDLLRALNRVATQLKEKAAISNVCVKVEDLQQGGYLQKNVKLPKNLSPNTYVLISFNEPTNQFSYSIAKTEKQIKTCNDYYAGQTA